MTTTYDTFAAVQAFQRKFQLPCPDTPTPLKASVMQGRLQMMTEELEELMKAFRLQLEHQETLNVPAGQEQTNVPLEILAEQADCLIDLVYFALGTAAMMGLPWQRLFGEVHAANMAKVLVANAAESKRLNKLDVKKPEGWVAPDLAKVMREDWVDVAARSHVTHEDVPAEVGA